MLRNAMRKPYRLTVHPDAEVTARGIVGVLMRTEDVEVVGDAACPKGTVYFVKLDEVDIVDQHLNELIYPDLKRARD